MVPACPPSDSIIAERAVRFRSRYAEPHGPDILPPMLKRSIDLLRASNDHPILTMVVSATLLPLLNGFIGLAVKDKIPFFMDSIFTAIAAAVWGPWQGIATALMTNVFFELTGGFTGTNLPFALCGAATALIVAAFVRAGGYKGPLGAILCIASVTLANSLLGALIATFVFGGGTHSNIDDIVAGFTLFTDSIFTAAFLARIPINFVDKAIAVIPALLLAGAIARSDSRE
jgi:energy-coupling factor transport system substrate-specific component